MGVCERSDDGMMDFNWFAAVFVGLLPASIIGMTVRLIVDHVKAKRGGTK